MTRNWQKENCWRNKSAVISNSCQRLSLNVRHFKTIYHQTYFWTIRKIRNVVQHVAIFVRFFEDSAHNLNSSKNLMSWTFNIFESWFLIKNTYFSVREFCHNGGVEETRTLAPVNPIYFLSREAPSPTWVLLQVNAPYLNIKGDYK